MKVGGFQRFSLLDYPAQICAVIFTQGCNFRCPYCHNPALVDPELFQNPISIDYIIEFLKGRIGKLDAVVITGGEPTIHNDLPQFILKIKQLGYLVKLDTNGSNPEMLEHLVRSGIVDYLAMDIKAPSDKYPFVTGMAVDVDDISRSIDIIKNSGIEYEFRSTLVDTMISREEVIKIGNLIGKAKRYYLQKFVAEKTLDEEYQKAVPFSQDKLSMLRRILAPTIGEIHIR